VIFRQLIFYLSTIVWIFLFVVCRIFYHELAHIKCFAVFVYFCSVLLSNSITAVQANVTCVQYCVKCDLAVHVYENLFQESRIRLSINVIDIAVYLSHVVWNIHYSSFTCFKLNSVVLTLAMSVCVTVADAFVIMVFVKMMFICILDVSIISNLWIHWLVMCLQFIY